MTTDFELFYKRIKIAAKVESDKELCEFLNLKKSTLSMWKKREKVDYELLFTKFEHIDLNWLIRGVEFNSGKTEDPNGPYTIKLQKKLIKKLEEEILRLKKEIEPTTGHYRAAEPDK